MQVDGKDLPIKDIKLKNAKILDPKPDDLKNGDIVLLKRNESLIEANEAIITKKMPNSCDGSGKFKIIKAGVMKPLNAGYFEESAIRYDSNGQFYTEDNKPLTVIKSYSLNVTA